MSIDRQYGFVVISCDDCENTFMANKGDTVDKVLSEAWDEGWITPLVANEAAFFCGQPCQPAVSDNEPQPLIVNQGERA